MLRTFAVTVGTSPTSVRTTTDSDETVVVYNNDTATVYLGDSTVTSSVGFPLPSGASLAVQLTLNSALYAVTASGTADLRVARTRG